MIEATLTSILVGFGTSRGVATLGVVAYRLINFWLPIPLGGLAYLSLQVDPRDPSRRRSLLGSAGNKLAKVFSWPLRWVPKARARPEVNAAVMPAAPPTPDAIGVQSPPA